MPHDPLYLGIDLGTGGVRAMAVSANGEVIAGSSVPFPKSDRTLPPGHHEQDANEWWMATQKAIAGVIAALHSKRISPEAITALAIDGTSGTIVGVDANGEPTGPALMYNDGRATAEAKELAELAAKDGPSPAGQIAASYAIAKIRWLEKHEPQQFASAKYFVHQADFIAAKLTGRLGVTDYSNALKTGYDLVANRWPAWLDHFPAIRQRLPQVVSPGATLGTLTTLASSPPLAPTTRVVAGATDGTAGFLASGARSPGDDNTTLGTTLVFKRLATHPVIDPRGLIYCHKLPGNLWLPGAASNTGCEWMSQRFPNADFKQLDRDAASHLPCESLAYPLARAGERFPFLAPQAAGFCDRPANTKHDYAAHLQGVAMIERLCYEVLNAATGVAGGGIYATGGGSHSDIWMQLRADVTGRVYHRPACPESAFGAAVLAAAADLGGLTNAIRSMVRIERRFDPYPAMHVKYDAIYARFTAALRERGWLQP